MVLLDLGRSVPGREMERLEALREGGPTKRVGAGRRWGLLVAVADWGVSLREVWVLVRLGAGAVLLDGVDVAMGDEEEVYCESLREAGIVGVSRCCSRRWLTPGVDLSLSGCVHSAQRWRAGLRMPRVA